MEAKNIFYSLWASKTLVWLASLAQTKYKRKDPLELGLLAWLAQRQKDD